jgi:hypothetical protein
LERIIWLPIAIVAAALVGFGIGLNIGRTTDKTTTVIRYEKLPLDARGTGRLGAP